MDDFLPAYKADFLEPRLKTSFAEDIAYPDEMWESPAVFLMYLPMMYCLSVPLALARLYSATRDLANVARYGHPRLNHYDALGALIGPEPAQRRSG